MKPSAILFVCLFHQQTENRAFCQFVFKAFFVGISVKVGNFVIYNCKSLDSLFVVSPCLTPLPIMQLKI